MKKRKTRQGEISAESQQHSEWGKVKKKLFSNIISLFNILIVNCSLEGVINQNGVFVFLYFNTKHIYM